MIEAQVGNGLEGDIAVDDVAVLDDANCTLISSQGKVAMLISIIKFAQLKTMSYCYKVKIFKKIDCNIIFSGEDFQMVILCLHIREMNCNNMFL